METSPFAPNRMCSPSLAIAIARSGGMKKPVPQESLFCKIDTGKPARQFPQNPAAFID